MDKQNALVKKLRSAAAILLVALYAAGLVAMLASRVRLALILWAISTLGGIGLLYWMRTVTRRKEEAEKAAGGTNASEER